MKPDKALTVLVYCDVVLTVLAIVVDRVLSCFLPLPLRGYLVESALSRGTGEALLAGPWWLVIAGTVLGSIGLLNLWRPARAIYFWSWVATLLLLPLEPAWVFSPVGYLLDVAATLVGGGLLGLLYFSDVRTHFERIALAASTAVPGREPRPIS